MRCRQPTSPPRRNHDLLFLGVLVVLLSTMAAHSQMSRSHAATVPAPALDACAAGSDARRLRCLEGAVAEIMAGDDLGAALAQVNDGARRDPLLAARCHMWLHEHGRRHPGRISPGTIDHDGKDCAAGFLHGWMLANLGTHGGLDRGTVDAWCGISDTALERADCEHGMGHVLLRNLRGDLPKALAGCRRLGGETRLRNCASGAFMENRFGGRGRDGAIASEHWRRGRPWRPCSSTPDDLLDACAAWAARDVPEDRRRAWCGSLPGGVGAMPCRIAIGVVAGADRAGRTVCGDDHLCWYGRGYAWAPHGWQQRSGDADPEAALRCLEAPPRQQRGCAAGVGFRRAAALPDTDGRAANSACDGTFTGAARAACRRGAARRHEPVTYA